MSFPPPYPLIEGFWIRNYRGLRQIAIGSSFQQSIVMDLQSDFVPYELTPLTVLTGESGVGKSTILDAFAFIADCLESNIDDALNKRGGFDAVYHSGSTGPIVFGLVFRHCAEPTPLTYVLNIDKTPTTPRPFVETEAILYRDAQSKQPRPVLFFQNGAKTARHVQPWVNASGSALAQIKSIDQRSLALSALAKYEDLPDIPQLRQYLARYFVASYTSPNAFGLAPPNFKLGQAESLATDLKRVKDKHPYEFERILDVIAKRMPNVEKLMYKTLESGRMVLGILRKGSTTPIFPPQLGESELRLLSHLLLLEDPIPVRMMGIEEPAASMGRKHVMAFEQALKNYVREMGGTQFFLTTHSNVLIDQMDPTDVWILYKDTLGDIQATRGIDELQFNNVDLNTVGPYWWSDYLYRSDASFLSGSNGSAAAAKNSDPRTNSP